MVIQRPYILYALCILKSNECSFYHKLNIKEQIQSTLVFELRYNRDMSREHRFLYCCVFKMSMRLVCDLFVLITDQLSLWTELQLTNQNVYSLYVYYVDRIGCGHGGIPENIVLVVMSQTNRPLSAVRTLSKKIGLRYAAIDPSASSRHRLVHQHS